MSNGDKSDMPLNFGSKARLVGALMAALGFIFYFTNAIPFETKTHALEIHVGLQKDTEELDRRLDIMRERVNTLATDQARLTERLENFIRRMEAFENTRRGSLR